MAFTVETEGMLAAERFAYFRDAVTQQEIPVGLRCDQPGIFSARLRADDFGPVTVATLSYGEGCTVDASRPIALVRKSDPEAYRLFLNRRGTFGSVQDGKEATLEPGTFGLYDSSLPFFLRRRPDYCQCLMVTFPRPLCSVPPRTVRTLVGVQISGREGIGALTKRLAVHLARDADRYSPADRFRLGNTMLDLVTATLMHELDSTQGASAESKERVLLLQVKSFIQQHLHDPQLSPATIAAAHHISIRTLHRLFCAHELTVAGHIRGVRLDRCRRDLADPLLHGVSIQRIGARWGFPGASNFSRVFRAAYGISPLEHRQENEKARAGREGAIGNTG